jgi:hypothetical protein
MPVTLGGELKFLWEVCTGSSTVEVFALGSEELCGLCASVVCGGWGGLSAGEVCGSGVAVICEGLSTRSNLCIFFSTWSEISKYCGKRGRFHIQKCIACQR